jgi:hypothetical protein
VLNTLFKKTEAMVTWENYEEYMLLNADGELNEAEQVSLQAFIALNPELQKEYELYSAVRFAPDTTQVYQQKEMLLKEEPQKKTIAFKGWWAYGAAAGITAIIGIWALKQPAQQPEVVHNTLNKVAPAIVTAPVVQEEKEIHSSPVKTIAIENQPVHQPTASIAKTIKTKSKEQTEAKITQPVIEPKVVHPQPAPETIAQAPQETEKPFRLQEPEIKSTLQPEQTPMHDIAEPKTVEAKTRRANLDVLALLDIDKTEGVTEFRGVVSEKLEKAKEIKNKIKGTDVRIKLGKKEIFVLKF